MIRYRYASQVAPPAPFVNVSTRCPISGNHVADVAAQIDTAADRTVLPGRLVSQLGLTEDGRSQFLGFAGEVVELPLYLVEIQIHHLPPCLILATIGEHEPFILMGRDAFNHYRIVLDGPNQSLEIDYTPPT